MNSYVSKTSRITAPANIVNTFIDSYSYISQNSVVSNTKIGKFCSIGPNFNCGFGLHPLNAISTSPMFYSKEGIIGYSFSSENTYEMRKDITIGNDVFIGSNVTILDGVKIGDGAVIGSGALVTKDIPPYAIAVGVPAKTVKYRFSETQISKLLAIKWWEWDENRLKNIPKDFYEIEKFISENYHK